jgi:hypothetical protein
MKETLEEVAKRYATDMSGTYYEDLYNAFINGAKWQKERSYSDEEVEILLETLSKVIVYQGNDYRLPHYFEYEIEKVIKKFKKEIR